MANEMRAISAFTGVPVIAYGFDDATKYAGKIALLRELLRRTSGVDDPPVYEIIAARMEEEKQGFTNPLFVGRCSVSPITGDRRWFKRQHDGLLFFCEASTFGRAAICCVRIPTIQKQQVGTR